MKIRYYDYLVVLSVVLILGAHGLTNFLVNFYADQSAIGGDIEKVLMIAEANPVARIILQMSQLNFMFSLVLVPGMIFGSYVWMRRHTGLDPYGAEHIAWIFLFIAVADFLNDATIVLGILLNQGVV